MGNTAIFFNLKKRDLRYAFAWAKVIANPASFFLMFTPITAIANPNKKIPNPI